MPNPEDANIFRSTIPSNLDQFADHHGVVDSLYAFQTMLDGKNWNEIQSAMQEDVHAYGVQGVDEVLATMRTHLDMCGATQHMMGNVQVQLDGDRAATRSYFRAFHAGIDANAGRSYECLGHYNDSWIRVGARWKLSNRVINVRAESGDRAVIALH